jgi:hypothetical protein
MNFKGLLEMSDNNIVQSSQYVIKELKIISKLGPVDITDMFEELNIFDSIFNPAMTGTILINDSFGLSGKLSFDGSEILLVDMGKTSDAARIKKSFRIYKQSSRKSLNLNSEAYILHFVSDEFILSQQIRISQAFKDTYANITKNILNNYLSVADGEIAMLEASDGIRSVVIPNKTPFEAIDFCTKRAVNDKMSPTFLFFENKLGYNFATTSTLLARPVVHNINFQPKNLADPTGELMGAMHYEVVTQFDMNKNIRAGVYAGTFTGFDINTRTVANKIVDFASMYNKSNHANQTPNIGSITNKQGFKNTEMFGSKKILYPITAFSSTDPYITENDPTLANLEDDTYNYLLQREAMMQNLMNLRMKIVMPGNFDLTSGLMANLRLPMRSEKAKGTDNIDHSLNGKYLIVATRHIITYQKHETVMEVATDSLNRDRIYQSTQEQESVDYGQ